MVIGSGGLFGGSGTVNGSVTNNGGILQVANSPTALRITGDFKQIGGRILLEVDPDGRGGFLTDTLVVDKTSLVDISNATINFTFRGGADAKLFSKEKLFNLDTF